MSRDETWSHDQLYVQGKVGASGTEQAARKELSTGKREPNLTPSVIFNQHSSYLNDWRGLRARKLQNTHLHTRTRGKMRTCTHSYRITTHTRRRAGMF